MFWQLSVKNTIAQLNNLPLHFVACSATDGTVGKQKATDTRCSKDVKDIRKEEHAEGLTGDGEEQSGSRCFGPLNFHVRQCSRPPGSASTTLGSAQLAGLLSWLDRKRWKGSKTIQDELVATTLKLPRS